MKHPRPTIQPYDDDDPLVAWVEEYATAAWRVRCPRATEVVLGRGSKVDLEVNLAACIADGVILRRRRGGGCTVVLDPGNVVVSVALPVTGIGGNKAFIEGLSDWVALGLASTGAAEPRRRGVSDLVIGEQKISGSCVHRGRHSLYYSASILVDADVSAVDRYLLHPPREPAYREGRAHGDFLTRLADFESNAGLTARALHYQLAEAFESEPCRDFFNFACLPAPHLYHYPA